MYEGNCHAEIRHARVRRAETRRAEPETRCAVAAKEVVAKKLAAKWVQSVKEVAAKGVPIESEVAETEASARRLPKQAESPTTDPSSIATKAASEPKNTYTGRKSCKQKRQSIEKAIDAQTSKGDPKEVERGWDLVYCSDGGLGGWGPCLRLT